MADGERRYTPIEDHYVLRERVAVNERTTELGILRLDEQMKTGFSDLGRKLDTALAARQPNTLPVPYQALPTQSGITRDDILVAARAIKSGHLWQVALIAVGAVFAYLFLHKWGIL